MSANEIILHSKLYTLPQDQRDDLMQSQQRSILRKLVPSLLFNDQDYKDIAALENRRNKSLGTQKFNLKFTGAETVALKMIEAERAKARIDNVSNPTFALPGSAEFLGQTVESIKRAAQNMANEQRKLAQKNAAESLKIKPLMIDTSKYLIHGDISPQTAATLRRLGIG